MTGLHCGYELAGAEVIEVASGVLAALPQLDPTPAAGTDFLSVGGIDTIELLATRREGLAHLSQGDFGQATAVLERAIPPAGMEYPIWRIDTDGKLGLVEAHLDDAQRLGARALTVAASVGAEHHVALNHAHRALALVCLCSSELEQCAVHLGAPGHPAFPLRSATDLDIRACLLARLAWLTHGPDSALRRLDEPFRSAVPPEVLRHARRGSAPNCNWPRVIRVAVMFGVDRNEAAATTALTQEVPMAEPEGLVRPFLDCALGDDGSHVADRAADRTRARGAWLPADELEQCRLRPQDLHFGQHRQDPPAQHLSQAERRWS